MLENLISRWPLLRQIRTGADGTGPEAMSAATRDLRPKHDGAEVTSSICPYCGVGCGQLVYHKNGKLISIEGDPSSPISRGRLCPKGADTFELHTHPERLTKVKYRRPYREIVGRDRSGKGDGHGRRSPVGEPRAEFRGNPGRRGPHADHRHRSPRRCDPRQRRELPDQETFRRPAWAWFASATRPGYDTAPPCPVWAHHSDAAARPLRSKI